MTKAMPPTDVSRSGSLINSIADAIGQTPMVRLSRIAGDLPHNLLGKCEFLNPGGSVKDRIASYMVARAEADGRLPPGGTMVEATAGNTGIGLAMIAALKGYKLITVMSSKVSSDKVKLLKALGAEVIIVPAGKPLDDPENSMNKARQIADSRGGWLVNQFYNSDNVRAHYETTGPEIWGQTGGTVDVLVAGVGTGGTLTGAGKYLKERKPSVQLVLADPVGSMLAGFIQGCESKSQAYVVEGIGMDFVPGNFDTKQVDAAIQISDQESIRTAHELMTREGIFVGSSAGCITAAAIKFSKNLAGEGKNIVVILPDGGRGYLSTIYDETWLGKLTT
jgi:cystathionine beta-synthase